MPLYTESQWPQRSRKNFFDECDSRCLRAAKPRQLQTLPTSSKPAQPSEPAAETVDAAWNPAKKRFVDAWIAGDPLFSPSNDEERPLLEVLQDISQSREAISAPVSATSAPSSRPATSTIHYRHVLYYNGIYIDHLGTKIPQELRKFLDSRIVTEQLSSLSSQEITEAVDVAVNIADASEGNVHDLIGTAMLPIKRADIGLGRNTLWNSLALPFKSALGIQMAIPKPDFHCGYPTGYRSRWTLEENAVIYHPVARRSTQPADGNSFPFLVLEMKSEAKGGTIWQAENQAAGSGAYCVNVLRWLLREAYPSDDQSIIDSIAFTACVTHRETVLHVHFYSREDDRHYMSWIATFETMRHVQQCNTVLRNVLDHGIQERQTKIRAALALLHPFPDHWKTSRPVNIMEQRRSDTEEGSNKSRRTE